MTTDAVVSLDYVELGARLLIAGGGIGGLTAALSAAAAGQQVLLFEQAAEFTEAGAGIQVSPNGARVLHHLGLEEGLRALAFVPASAEIRHWRTGALIAESPLGEAALARYGAPYYHIHRGDLLTLLATAASQHPGIELVKGARVENFEAGDKVTLHTSRGSWTGDLLVGADGIHSVVAKQLWGEAAPTFTGNIAWRALVPKSNLPEGLVPPKTGVWWGPGRHFVHYYVRGGELINCVCVVEKPGWEIESWTEPGDYEELKADFAGWHSSLQQLLDGADRQSLYKWALFDRAPLKTWGRGRVTLLGDACHPTLPFLAQGAVMAIEDAAVLAASLSKGWDAPQALRVYEKLRRRRTRAVQLGSRRNATLFHLSGTRAWLRNLMAKPASGRTLDKLYRYDALNAL